MAFPWQWQLKAFYWICRLCPTVWTVVVAATTLHWHDYRHLDRLPKTVVSLANTESFALNKLDEDPVNMLCQLYMESLRATLNSDFNAVQSGHLMLHAHIFFAGWLSSLSSPCIHKNKLDALCSQLCNITRDPRFLPPLLFLLCTLLSSNVSAHSKKLRMPKLLSRSFLTWVHSVKPVYTKLLESSSLCHMIQVMELHRPAVLERHIVYVYGVGIIRMGKRCYDGSGLAR